MMQTITRFLSRLEERPAAQKAGRVADRVLVVSLVLLTIWLILWGIAKARGGSVLAVTPAKAQDSGWLTKWTSSSYWKVINGVQYPCRSKTGTITRYGYYGPPDVLYKYAMRLQACIAGPSKLWLRWTHTNVGGSTPDPTWTIVSTDFSDSSGGCSGGTSCHAYSRRQEAKICNDPVSGVCLRHEYPWVKIEAVVKNSWAAPQLRFYGWTGVN